ncbi:MAG: ATP synthase F1 subunit epsilon [Clostridia bacterium]|nr:ATP synthase F1 subunit epsilon [Clostridia bacterium]
MNTFSLKVIASNRIFFEGNASLLVVPGIDGEYGILAHHENTVIATREGLVRFVPEKGDEVIALAGIGFCEIDNNEVTFLADTVERPEEIDVLRAQAALERAQEQLRQRRSQWEYQMSQASLARALERLKESSRAARG